LRCIATGDLRQVDDAAVTFFSGFHAKPPENCDFRGCDGICCQQNDPGSEGIQAQRAAEAAAEKVCHTAKKAS
jgi:hypothetical protein